MEPAPPRYLRFVTALVLGGAIASVPVALVACGDDAGPQDHDAEVAQGDDAGDDAGVDAPIDADTIVDGPLPPPDLPRIA